MKTKNKLEAFYLAALNRRYRNKHFYDQGMRGALCQLVADTQVTREITKLDPTEARSLSEAQL